MVEGFDEAKISLSKKSHLQAQNLQRVLNVSTAGAPELTLSFLCTFRSFVANLFWTLAIRVEGILSALLGFCVSTFPHRHSKNL